MKKDLIQGSIFFTIAIFLAYVNIPGDNIYWYYIDTGEESVMMWFVTQALAFFGIIGGFVCSKRFYNKLINL
jgi:hypothetical protein